MTPQYITFYKDGSKFYYKDKQMNIPHREDGPAVEYPNGYKAWYINGNVHRTDGPAVEYADGEKRWYLNGKELSEAEFLKRTSPEIVMSMDEIAAKLGIDVSKLKIVK